MPRPPRPRRQKNYWEPIFNANDAEEFPDAEIDKNHNGCNHSTISESSFLERRHFRDQRFDTCDFLGAFEKHRYTFTKCHFVKCDFGLSRWKNTKFSDCNFVYSSFTQTTFENCEFRDCSWTDVGIAGNETNFIDTTISNPSDFIKAAYTNMNKAVLAEKQKTRLHQKQRLEQTKATVSRSILAIHLQKGEERWYYEAVRVYTMQSLRASTFKSVFYLTSKDVSFKTRILSCLSLISSIFEAIIIWSVGSINNWGASLLRPLVFGVTTMGCFAAVYRHESISKTWLRALMKSFDITIVAGYTKQASISNSDFEQRLYAANLCTGLIWFAIVVPTLINRICRVR